MHIALIQILIGFAPAVFGVTLTWNENPEADIVGYRVYYGETNSPMQVVDTSTNKYELTALAPGHTYYFYVTAYNNAGLESEPSQIVYYNQPSNPPEASGSAATHVETDLRTSGMWRGHYGSEGGISPWGYFPIPSFVSVRGRNNFVWGWDQNLYLESAFQTIDGSGRIPYLWYNQSSFELDLTFKDSFPHTTSFYFFDFGDAGRLQKLELFDLLSGKLLGETTIANFGTGLYSTWQLSGKIRVRISAVSGPNCVMSGILFGIPESQPVPSSTALFLSADSQTGGTWKGIYGSSGQIIPSLTLNAVPYANTDIPGANSWIWNSNTVDRAALQQPDQEGRLASTWYDKDQFTVHVHFNDPEEHLVSFYFLDFDGGSRKQSVEVFDVHTGLLLESAILSDFFDGVWLKYRLSGRLIIRVRREEGANAVMSGIFFD